MSEISLGASRVLVRQDYPGDYTLLRVATNWATDLQPGHALPIAGVAWPVLQASPEQGWAECLQRQVPRLAVGESVRVSNPTGEPFDLAAATPRALLLADNDGAAAVLFLARRLRNWQPRVKPFALFELTPPLPFQPQPSRVMIPGLPASVIGALPLLEDWSIPSRIAGPGEFIPGSFEGTVAELACGWLDVSQGVADITVFASGGAPLLEAAQALAASYHLSCQIRIATQR